MSRDVVIVGTGAIAALRHLPAVRRIPGARVLGVVGTDAAAVDTFARRAHAVHHSVMEVGTGDLPAWIEDADLVSVATPPRSHTAIAQALARTGVPVVMEKPLLVDEDERDVWAALADAQGPLGVMHNFQLARGFVQAERWIAQGRIGEVIGVQCLQWSSDRRRLPRWYRDLPLGLFWDESVHFLYLSRRLAGDLTLAAAYAVAAPDPAETTPRSLDVQLASASGVPVSIAMRFGTALSEWGIVVAGTDGTLVYDMYRDIPLVLPDDGPHRAPQIVRTSLTATVQHWLRTVDNGVRILRGTQLYGVDEVLTRMLDARHVSGGHAPTHVPGDAAGDAAADAVGDVPEGLRVEDGLVATDLMRAIVRAVGSA